MDESTVPPVLIAYLTVVYLFIGIGVLGYILNIVKITGGNLTLMRIVGVFIPIIGAIVGWF